MNDAVVILSRQTGDGTAKSIEENLRLSEEMFRVLADTMPQLVWSTLPDGYHDYYNARWFEYTGLEFEDTQGEKWNDVLHPNDQARAWEVWRNSLETGDPYEIEYRLKRHDGVYRWFIGRALAIRDESGEIVRWFGTCTDIHDQKRNAEILLQQRAEIEKLNAHLRRSMIETHHRVKNNLQMVSALIEMQSNAENPSPDAMAQLSNNVRALGVIHDILTQEAKEDGEAQTLSIRAVVLQLIAVLEHTTHGRKIVSRLEDVRLRGRQATSLALVVNELISNALKHAVGDVEVTLRVEPNRIVLTVADDGAGFPADFDALASANTGLDLIENLVALDLAGQTTYGNRESGGGIVTVTLPRKE